MSEQKLLSEITLNGKALTDCEMFCESGNYRLYVDRSETGFCAKAVGHISYESGDKWLCKNAEAEELFSVTAYFDGVRHLEFNRSAGDMAGYIYYPSMKDFVVLIQKVRDLELELCRDCDK